MYIGSCIFVEIIKLLVQREKGLNVVICVNKLEQTGTINKLFYFLQIVCDFHVKQMKCTFMSNVRMNSFVCNHNPSHEIIENRNYVEAIVKCRQKIAG